MSKEKKRKSKFWIGAVFGAIMGVLFAPAKGSETRKSLMKKIEELMEQVKKIDLEEIKEAFDEKIEEIQEELEELDKEKVMKIAKERAAQLKEKAEDLFNLAKEKGTPIIEKTAKEVLEKVIDASKEIIKKLETKE